MMNRSYYIIFLLLQVIMSTACNTNTGSSNKDDEVSIETILSIPTSFRPIYHIHHEEDSSIAGAKRMSLYITVPLGLDKQTLENNLKHAAMNLYKQAKPDALMIFAYREGDKAEGSYSAARLVLAPLGDWSKASENVFIDKYSAVFDIADIYTNPKTTTIEIGSTVIEFDGEYISLYKNPNKI